MISICFNDVCSRDYDKFTVIYDLRNKMILKLEAVAADIWNYIYGQGCVEVGDIVNYITDLYECSGEDIVRDIETFLEELYESGTIQIDHNYIDDKESFQDVAEEDDIDFETLIIQELQTMNQLYSVTFEMTYACNEKCIHCYAHNADSNYTTKNIPVKVYKDVIDQLYILKCMHISFTGGDPFMNKDFLEIYRYARKKGFVCDIFTNALYLADNQDVMDEIIETRPRAFYISLYGANARTHDSVTGVRGSFDKTLMVARYLQSKKVSVVFNIMILSINHNETDQIIELVKDIGAEYRISMSLIYTNSGSDSPMNYFVGNKESIKNVLKIARKKVFSFDVPVDDIAHDEYICSAGVTSLSISPNGDIYPCISLKNKLGNIAVDSIRNVWDGTERTYVMNSLKWEFTKECSKCKYQRYCAHCPGISQAETGDCFSCNTCDRIIAQCMSEL